MIDDAGPVTTALTIVLATVVLGLAAYQVVLAAVFYRRLRPRFLSAAVAACTHRIVGTTASVGALAVAVLCVLGYEPGDALEDGGRTAVHVVAGSGRSGGAVPARARHRGGDAARADLGQLGAVLPGMRGFAWDRHPAAARGSWSAPCAPCRTIRAARAGAGPGTGGATTRWAPRPS